MKTKLRWWIAVVLAGALSAGIAQERPSDLRTGAEELEPAVDTSALPAEATDSAADAATPPTTGEEEPTDSAGESRDGDAAAADGDRASAPSAGATRQGGATDRIELEATQIIGNRELPKVLYIVPWKRSDLGDLVGKPVNSLLDEVLMPVDRDVFRRENRYYRTLAPDGAGPGAAAGPSGGGTAAAEPRAAGAEK